MHVCSYVLPAQLHTHTCTSLCPSLFLPTRLSFSLTPPPSLSLSLSLSPSLPLLPYSLPPKQKSVESIVATLRVLMESSVEELKIIQTILLLVTSTDVVQGKSLAKV